MKDAIGFVIAATGCIAALFLIIYGAVNNDAGLLSVGTTMVGGAIGSVITYFFTQQQTATLKEQVKYLMDKIGCK